jgi:Protein of unknown function (DUF3285)
LLQYCYNKNHLTTACSTAFDFEAIIFMSHSSPAQASEPTTELTPAKPEAPPSYVKLAMRNMVRKRGTSLKHFALTTIGLLAVLIGLAYLTR